MCAGELVAVLNLLLSIAIALCIRSLQLVQSSVLIPDLQFLFCLLCRCELRGSVAKINIYRIVRIFSLVNTTRLVECPLKFVDRRTRCARLILSNFLFFFTVTLNAHASPSDVDLHRHGPSHLRYGTSW